MGRTPSATALSAKNDRIDLIDRRILSALMRDGRLTNGELAAKVGLSPSSCWTRVKKLESEGAIERYAAIISHAALGLANFVFVEITLEKHDDKVLDQFGAAVARMPEVVEADLVTGEYDYLIKVAVRDNADYERFLRERLYRIEGVRHTRSTFSLRALKWSTSIDPLLLGER
jgi:Lrp/AsnC family transcriptional regulator, leucine-responsive regulatory protein